MKRMKTPKDPSNCCNFGCFFYAFPKGSETPSCFFKPVTTCLGTREALPVGIQDECHYPEKRLGTIPGIDHIPRGMSVREIIDDRLNSLYELHPEYAKRV